MQQDLMNIQTYMDRKRLGDNDMAELLGVNKTTVWRIRRGKTRPSADLLKIILEVTGGKVSANDFFHPRD